MLSLRLHSLEARLYKPGRRYRFCFPVGILVCICFVLFNVASMWNLFSSSESKVTTGSGVPVLALLALAAARTTLAVDTTVELNYTSYSGTALSNGVTQWLGMRFAAPPLGDLRFCAPQDPEQEDGPVEADVAQPYCIGTDGGPPTDAMDEDCLFLNVYAPSNATSDSKLPVFFFIQGGGFNTNGPSANGSGLVIAGDMDLIVVNFNYRVGPYGEAALPPSSSSVAERIFNTNCL